MLSQALRQICRVTGVESARFLAAEKVDEVHGEVWCALRDSNSRPSGFRRGGLYPSEPLVSFLASSSRSCWRPLPDLKNRSRLTASERVSKPSEYISCHGAS